MVVFNKRKVAISIIAAIAAAPAFADDSKDKIYVTTASGYQQKIEDAPASISVVTREQLETKAYRDVTDALKDVPGVLVTGGGSSSDISIRGMDAKYTMILIDGKRVDTRSTRPNSDGSGIEQGWLPPLPAIERIEVVRGPMSSLYGSDAMGGLSILSLVVFNKSGRPVYVQTQQLRNVKIQVIQGKAAFTPQVH